MRDLPTFIDHVRTYPLHLEIPTFSNLIFHHHNHNLSTLFSTAMRNHQDNDGTQVLYQLFSMITNILGSPPLPIPFPTSYSLASSSSSSRRFPQVSPIGFAGLFIGISFAMMLFGAAIFVIGFMLMPLVVSLVMLFYLARVVSGLSYLAGVVIFPSSNIVTAYTPTLER